MTRKLFVDTTPVTAYKKGILVLAQPARLGGDQLPVASGVSLQASSGYGAVARTPRRAFR